MKYKKQCPRCGCREIFMMDQDRMAQNQPTQPGDGRNYYSNVTVEQYICCQCGYSEQWVNYHSMADRNTARNPYRLNK